MVNVGTAVVVGMIGIDIVGLTSEYLVSGVVLACGCGVSES